MEPILAMEPILPILALEPILAMEPFLPHLSYSRGGANLTASFLFQRWSQSYRIFPIPEETKPHLSKAPLSKAHFMEAHLSKAHFMEAHLSKAHLSKALLSPTLKAICQHKPQYAMIHMYIYFFKKKTSDNHIIFKEIPGWKQE